MGHLGGMGKQAVRNVPDTKAAAQDVPTGPQHQFESAVLTILTNTVGGVRRIDLAVEEYLKTSEFSTSELYVRPDMIICVADCQDLLIRSALRPEHVRPLLERATQAWRDADQTSRLTTGRGVTRIQACIGNIRRAITSVL